MVISMRSFVHFFYFASLMTVHLFSSDVQSIKKDLAAFNFSPNAFQKHLYNNLSNKHYLCNHRQNNPIPKIIHLIWLGPKPIPKMNQKCIQSWKDLHPTWQIKLWTDKDLANFDFLLLPKIKECRNYGLKSDLLRYELLYKYGGIYTDVDFFCKKPFDVLCERHSFFMGSFTHDTIMNSIMGAAPKHPLLLLMINTLYKNTINPLAKGDEVQNSTGPFFLTRMTGKYVKKKHYHSDIVVYPPNYFFPNGKKIVHSDKLKLFLSPETLENYAFDETFAIHLFTTTWKEK